MEVPADPRPERAAGTRPAASSTPSSPLQRQEGAALRALRHAWNAAISLMLGAMIGIVGHEYVADAASHVWPGQFFVGDIVRALFWAVGVAATGLLFFSYYLDDGGR